MFEVVLEFFGESNLRSFLVFELVDSAGRSGDKVSKVGIEGVIRKCNQYVWAEAGGRGARGVIPVNDSRCMLFERVEFVHPSS